MNILSRESQCHCWSSSPWRIWSSFFRSSTVLSTLRLRISRTPRKTGLSSSITHAEGEIATWQLVKTHSCWINFSGSAPCGRWTRISTWSAVLSSTRLILILPLAFAARIDSMTDSVVVAYGSSVIARRILLLRSIRARIFTFPPRSPSLYSEKSASPPVGKSGYIRKVLPWRWLMAARQRSLKLCGRILVERPTAIPSAPSRRTIGNLAGRVMGSFARPS